MITFQEFINEALDTKPVKWDLVNDSFTKTVYKFDIGKNVYAVFFDFQTREDKPVSVSFGMLDNETKEMSFVMTNGGNTAKVLMTVLDTIKDFVKNKDPAGITFSARKEINAGKDSKSRASVYARMVKKFGPKGWTLETKDTGHEVIFNLMKP